MVPAAAFSFLAGKPFDRAFNRFAFCLKALRSAGFKPSSRLVPAAMALCAASIEGSERLMASRAYSVYRSMRRWRTARMGWELFATAVFMACSDLRENGIISQVSRAIRRLHAREAGQKRGLHFLYQALALDAGSLEEAALRCAEIYPRLEKMGFKSPALLYGSMGFLALSGDDCSRAMLEAMDAMSLLKLGKCFPAYEREQAMLTASAIVAASRMRIRAESSQAASMFSSEVHGYSAALSLLAPDANLSQGIPAACSAVSGSAVSHSARETYASSPAFAFPDSIPSIFSALAASCLL